MISPRVPAWLPGVLLACLLAVPAYWFLSYDLFPFTDLPNHLAAATIYRHIDDPQTPFAEYFIADVSVVKPNIAHLVFCSWFASAEAGNSIWMLGAVGLLGVSLVLLFRLTGSTNELLPLGVLLVMNGNVSWGFVGFVLAMPLLLLLACALIYHGRVRSLFSNVLIAVLLIVLFYVHVLALLFGVAFVILSVVLDARRSPGKRTASLLLCVVPALLLLIIWVLTAGEFKGGSNAEFLSTYYRYHFAGSLLARLGRLLTNDFHVLATGSASVPLTGVFGAALVGGIVLLLRGGRSATLWAGNRIIVSLFGAAILAYMVLPDRLPDQAHLYSRFSIIFLGSALLVAAAGKVFRGGAMLLGGTTCIALVYLFCWHGYLSDFNGQTAGFTRAFLAQAKGTVLAGIVRDPEFRTAKPLVHFPNYHTIWNLGVTPIRIVSYRFGAIRMKTGGKALPEYHEWVSPATRTEDLVSRYKSAEILLFHTRNENGPRDSLAGFSERGRSGGWALYVRQSSP